MLHPHVFVLLLNPMCQAYHVSTPCESVRSIGSIHAVLSNSAVVPTLQEAEDQSDEEKRSAQRFLTSANKGDGGGTAGDKESLPVEYLDAIAERERRRGAHVTVTTMSNDSTRAASPVAPVGTRPYRLLSQAISETFSRQVRKGGAPTFLPFSASCAGVCVGERAPVGPTFWWSEFVNGLRMCMGCHS